MLQKNIFNFCFIVLSFKLLIDELLLNKLNEKDTNICSKLSAISIIIFCLIDVAKSFNIINYKNKAEDDRYIQIINFSKLFILSLVIFFCKLNYASALFIIYCVHRSLINVIVIAIIIITSEYYINNFISTPIELIHNYSVKLRNM